MSMYQDPCPSQPAGTPSRHPYPSPSWTLTLCGQANFCRYRNRKKVGAELKQEQWFTCQKWEQDTVAKTCRVSVGSLQIVSDHPDHDGDAPDGGVAASLEQLGHQEVEQVGQDVQHLKGNISPPAYVVYTPHSCSLLCSECRDTQLCGWCQLVWRNSGNCDSMIQTRHQVMYEQ